MEIDREYWGWGSYFLGVRFGKVFRRYILEIVWKNDGVRVSDFGVRIIDRINF